MAREYGKAEGNRETEVVSILKRHSFLGNWSPYSGIIVTAHHTTDAPPLMIVLQSSYK
jgi:predicted aconitase with swiveling domain